MDVLAADEQPDAATEGQARERIDASVSKFFHMLDRLMTVLRVYPRHHPVVDSVTEQAIACLREVFGAGQAVTVELTPTAILSEWGGPLFSLETSESERFIWYKPHSDGLRYLTFRPALSVGELQSLMAVITAVDAGELGSDDDTITLLWEKQLDGISYRSVDSFVDAETIEEFNQRTSREVVDLLVEAAADPQGSSGREVGRLFNHVGIGCLDWFTSQRIDATFTASTVGASEDDLSFALSIAGQLVEDLNEEWYSGSLLEFRFVEALLSVIRTSPQSLAAEHARMVIEKMTLEMIDKEMYQAAIRVLELLRSRDDVLGPDGDNPLDALFANAAEPERVDGLLWRMQKVDEEADTLQTLLSLLDPDLVQRRVLLQLANEEAELAAPGRGVSLLLAVTDEENADAVCDPELLERETLVRRLLEEVDADRLADWPPARDIIVAALDSDNDALQQAALALDFAGWSDMALARSALLPMIEHRDVDVRTRVYELLSEYQPHALEEKLRVLVDSGDFGRRSMGEIRFLLTKYVDAHPRNLADLRAKLDTRGWFGQTDTKVAKAAARILLEKQDDEAAEKISEFSRSLLTSPRLKEAYVRLLQSNGYGDDS